MIKQALSVILMICIVITCVPTFYGTAFAAGQIASASFSAMDKSVSLQDINLSPDNLPTSWRIPTAQADTADEYEKMPDYNFQLRESVATEPISTIAALADMPDTNAAYNQLDGLQNVVSTIPGTLDIEDTGTTEYIEIKPLALCLGGETRFDTSGLNWANTGRAYLYISCNDLNDPLNGTFETTLISVIGLIPGAGDIIALVLSLSSNAIRNKDQGYGVRIPIYIVLGGLFTPPVVEVWDVQSQQAPATGAVTLTVSNPTRNIVIGAGTARVPITITAPSNGSVLVYSSNLTSGSDPTLYDASGRRIADDEIDNLHWQYTISAGQTMTIYAGTYGNGAAVYTVTAIFPLYEPLYVTLDNFSSLQNAVEEVYPASKAHVIITVTDSFEMTGGLTIPENPSGAYILLRSDDTTRTLTRRTDGVCYGYLFCVEPGAKLILENIIIDGNKHNYTSSNTNSLIYNRGEFSMTIGAVLRNNRAYNGGGVLSHQGGTFNMFGGEISNNTTQFGGGVSGAQGIFNMFGGKIIDNSASSRGGGVSVGTFTMLGGEITGNTTYSTSDTPNYNGSGGGVVAYEVTIGGTSVISGNTSSNRSNYNNLYLDNGIYITLSTNTPPAPGMIIGVGTETPSGVIVETGANSSHAQYFFANSPGSGVAFSPPGQLVIVPADIITVTVSSVGTGATGGGNYSERAPVSICAGTPPAGMVFKNWTSTPAVAFADANSNCTTFTMPSVSVTVTAKFESQLTVYDFIGLQTAITNYGTATSDILIYVAAGFPITNSLSIPSNAYGATLAIRSADPQIPVTLTRSFSGTLFSVNSGVKLILENIIIDGDQEANPNNTGLLIQVSNGGEFTMKEGTVLMNNRSANSSVRVAGIFTMTGGLITGNTNQFSGGGVYVYGGEFTMTGGKISGNTATSAGGGVLVLYGTFTMTGGEISGNTAQIAGGGGVFLDGTYGGEFTMTGGVITGNTAYRGGGVCVYAAFTLGGTAVINGNTSDNVYLTNGTHIMLSTEAPPALGMNVSVQIETGLGVVVNSGASASHAQYFFADEPGREVSYENGRLLIDYKAFKGLLDYPSATDNMIIELTQNLTLTGTAIILENANGKTLTIRSANPANPVILTRGFSGTGATGMFTINNGAKLILENIIIDGDQEAYPDNTGSLVTVASGGEFTMKNGTVLRNNRSASYSGHGGGVTVRGTFTMTGGIITGNTAQFGGGGVYNTGTFTMTGGKISGNTANAGGGVYNTGIFTMTGGEITENTANVLGGGICVSSDTLTLGGTAVIIGNVPDNVYLANDRYITLSTEAPPALGFSVGVQVATGLGVVVNSGASASHAQYFFADEPGREVSYENGRLLIDYKAFKGLLDYPAATDNMIIELTQNLTLTETAIILENANGKTLTIRSANPANPVTLTRGFSGIGATGMFTISNGAKLILENIIIDGDQEAYPDNTGSLVTVASGGELNVKDGTVLRNNRSASYSGPGGGVTVAGTFTMTGGVITGNTAQFSGGGVVVSGGVFMMTGGKISGNTANAGGGVYNIGTFTMTGGEITENTADVFGGGTYVYGGGTLTLGGTAVIIDNTRRNNESDNIYLANGRYITLDIGNDAPVLSKMNVGVRTGTPSGVIVESGANASHAQYFFADEPGKTLVYANGQLLIESAPSYTVTVSSAGTGATGGGNYVAGATVSINAGTPPAGQQFKNWTSSPTVPFANASSASTAFTMPAGAVTVTANFETPCYAVTGSSAGTGATVGGCYVPGATVPINAGTPPAGMLFKNWTSSPAVTFANANSASTTFTMPANAVTITANFEIPPVITYAVTVSSAGTGATGGGNYAAGANVGISAGTPPVGQRFKNWIASPDVSFANANSANTTFTMPANAVTVTAIFETDVTPEEYIFVTGMRPEFQVGFARYDSTWVYEPGFYGSDFEFMVAGGDGPFMLWIGIPDVYPKVMVDGINAGETVDVSDNFYDVVVPSGVSGVGISFYEGAWYIDDFSEGDVITLLKTNEEGLLVFERNGVYYEKTFVPDGSNPFPGEEPGVEPVVTVPSASVQKLGGGKERLTISLTETLSDGSTVAGTVAVTINENTAGYYTVGSHLIYVDALGSGSIRRCYIVNRD